MIIYNGKNSLKDFDLYIAAKDIPVPERKKITETVPYMSGLWDFSYHDGVDEYEAVTLAYEFDVIADSKQELNAQKTVLLAWLHGSGDGKLYDTDISTEFYYSVYQAQAAWKEDGLQGLLSVQFLCYPYRKAKKRVAMRSKDNTSYTAYTVNNTSVREASTVAIVTGGDINIVSDLASHALNAGTYENYFVLPVGTSEFKIKGFATLTLEYEIEVL